MASEVQTKEKPEAAPKERPLAKPDDKVHKLAEKEKWVRWLSGG